MCVVFVQKVCVMYVCNIHLGGSTLNARVQLSTCSSDSASSLGCADKVCFRDFRHSFGSLPGHLPTAAISRIVYISKLVPVFPLFRALNVAERRIVASTFHSSHVNVSGVGYIG